MNQPLWNRKDGTLSASLFENEGKHGSFHTIQFQRGYQDQEGNWQNQFVSLTGRQLLQAAALLVASYEASLSLRNETHTTRDLHVEDAPESQPKPTL